MAARNYGAADSSEEHLRGLFEKLREYVKHDVEGADPEWHTFEVACEGEGSGRWTMCMLLWMHMAATA